MARICLVLFTALLLQAVGKAENPPIDPKTASSVPLPVLPKGSRVLFQGDSITDGNRGRNEDPNHILGHGYQFIIACRYGSAYADQDLAFFNRGVSGNTVTELKDRWQKDTLDLKPDLLSILIGINDEGRGISPQQYEESYDYLLTKVRELNPKVRLVLGEPFILPRPGSDPDYENKRKKLKIRQEIVAKLAKKHGAAFVPYQKAFDDACKRAPATHWIWDGIHPTYAGHQIMADEWLRTVNQVWPKSSGK